MFQNTAYTTAGESTPIVWNNELLYVRRYTESDGIHTAIFRESDGTKVADTASGLEFISALVSNNTLYVFGSVGQHVINMISTADLVNWTAAATVYTARAGESVYNNSVTATPTGYVMAYEVCESGQICFNDRFLQSSNLTTWTSIVGDYETGYYTACPTIRYSNGYYYLLYLSKYYLGNTSVYYYATNISRSTDLSNWTFSTTTVLSPLDGGDIAFLNNSDIDLVEYNNQVRMIYLDMSQDGINFNGQGLREATYNGTLDQFLTKFF